MREEIEKALGEIKPALQNHGGDVELIDVDDDGVVSVKLKGACAGCPMSQMTMRMGIERIIKSKVSGVKKVVAVE